MARTELTVQEINFQKGEAIVGIAGDAANNHVFVNDGKTLLYVKNAGGGAVLVTIVSVKDSLGRLQDEVLSVAAGEEAIFAPTRKGGWSQKSGVDQGKTLVDIDVDTSVTLAALRILF